MIFKCCNLRCNRSRFYVFVRFNWLGKVSLESDAHCVTVSHQNSTARRHSGLFKLLCRSIKFFLMQSLDDFFVLLDLGLQLLYFILVL